MINRHDRITIVKKGIVKARDFLRKHPTPVFVFALLMISILYYYHVVAFSPPQSIHRWRQTDCTSIALNFYQNGMHLFKPEVHNLISDDYTTGYSAGEAPILYYAVAFLYKLFGPDDTIYRIFNTLVFFAGIVALFRISYHFLKDYFIASFVALLVFTSPVAAYYGCNFLPDSTALSFVFFGWWQFIRYYTTGRVHLFLLAVLFFTLAGLIKVSMSISLIALLGLVILHHLKWPVKVNSDFNINPLKTYLPFLVAMGLIAGWYLYAIRFNRNHESGTFLTGIRPWWDLTGNDRQNITTFIVDNNLTLYFSRSILYYLAACLVFVLIFSRRIPSWLVTTTWLLVAGGVIYANLWYAQFQYHDYYFMTLLVPVVFIMIASMTAIRSLNTKIFGSWIFRLVLFIFLAFNVFHARHEMKLRYFGWKREMPLYEEYFTIRPYLKSIGIRPEDRVISIPDATSCYTLYMMNQPGNNMAGINSTTSDYIRKFIDLGAKYLFVNDTAMLRDPALVDFLKIKAGQSGNVHIFRLDSLADGSDNHSNNN